MTEFLAVLTVEGIGVGATGMTALGLLALLVRRGFHLDVGKTHNGNGGGKKPAMDSVSRLECSIIHTALEKLEKERHDVVVSGINEVKTEVKAGLALVHARINEIIKERGRP